MPTYKNIGILVYEFPGDGSRPAQTVEPGGTVEAPSNPNQLYFEWVEGDLPEGTGDYPPPQPAEPAAEPESVPEPAPTAETATNTEE